ncbi:FAD-dependent oxidoreductase [Candidatus Berkelbacteria bacterium]|nr:FAD-dependent oxidoreductase [Candidatus Berkelbacteria bacterium]
MQTKLLQRVAVATGTIACFLEKPAGFTFQAGQSLDLTLLDPPTTDDKGNTRSFSLVSAPHEPQLEIATRVRESAFKHHLQSLPLGTTLEFDGPFGSMTLHRDTDRPAVFLAGGIGITPFMSMIRDASVRRLEHKLYLFYSNRSPGDAPFLEELHTRSIDQSQFHLITTMTDREKPIKDWQGETGYINQAMIEKYVTQPTEAIYYLAGPSPMVKAMLDLLQTMEIDELQIKSEEFTGY